ncbi:TPA: DNA cytosine methyltransferase [Stenotrophomonas maltophilia]|nr:DNA cytosine methyltransferase [Stenotrophomonas maltophilia]HDS1042200.1 DNA cytosine methyltransferase [Stenotrophomonas maltophilia]
MNHDLPLPARPKIIDLFAGVGGLSLGAARAGFDVAACVELDAIAIASHAQNFPNSKHISLDVASLTGAKLEELSGVPAGELAGLIGGPPCQGFSLIGRRNSGDTRNDLFTHFFRLVAELKPAFYLAENVPGILSKATSHLIDSAIKQLPNNYIKLAPIIVEADKFGAPTTRKRVFFIGYDPKLVKDLKVEDFLPKEAHSFVVKDALQGLPTIYSSWQKEDQSWRRVKYFESNFFSDRLTGHIPPGVGDGKAIEQLKSQVVSGFFGTQHSDETVSRFKLLAPGELDAVYRSRRLRMEGLCPTLRAGTAADKGSYQAVRPIHPTAARVIAPREAARLQGFPDWFVFNPTKWHSFRQIGNSVSPLVAEGLLSVIRESIKELDGNL